MKKVIYFILTIFIIFSFHTTTNASYFQNYHSLVLKCNSDDLSGCEKEEIIKKVNKSGVYELSIKDRAGNSKTKYFKLNDKIITDDKLSWNNKTRTISINCNKDDLSGCIGGKKTKQVSKNGEYLLYTKDRAGNVTGQIFQIKKIDTIAPGVNFSCDNKSKNVDGKVSCTIIGNNSNIGAPETLKVFGETKGGILPKFSNLKYTKTNLVCLKRKKVLWFHICKEYSKPKQTYSFSDNGTYTIKGQIVDDAGNKSKLMTKTFKIDTSAPSINTNYNFNRWYNTNNLQNIYFNLKDQIKSTDSNEESGLSKVEASLNGKNIKVNGFKSTNGTTNIKINISKNDLLKYLQEGNNNFILKVFDKVNHKTEIKYIIKYDKTKPKLDVDNKNYNWTNTDIKIKLSTQDQIGLSGLKYSKYIWDNSTSCDTSGTNFTNGQEIILTEEGKHTLYICNEDNAGNKNIVNFGKYKLDKTKPKLDVDNKNYNWNNTNIKIKLSTQDQIGLSGLKYSKYVWNNSGSCDTSGTNFTNGQDIILTEEGEHTLYICNEDNAGNKNIVNFGKYKLDKTRPNIILNISNSEIAGENNFEVKFKLYDNLNGGINKASYNKYKVKYNYKIIADTKSKNNIFGDLVVNNEKIDTYSLTDSSENGENFKIIFNIEDKAGNKNTLTKTFKIFPHYLSRDNSIIIVNSTGDKYANNSDKYIYTLELKDKYNNPIYGKTINYINQESSLTGFKTIKNIDGTDSLIEQWSGITDNNGKISFSLKSYTPGEFSQSFKIKMNKWGDDYINNSDITEIEKSISNKNQFKKPVKISELKIVSGGEYPEIGKEQKYELRLENIGNAVFNGNLDIEKNYIKPILSGHKWLGNLKNIKNNISNTDLKSNFIGQIDAEDNILKAPGIDINNLPISYTIGGKQVKYNLDNYSLAGNSDCNKETLGVKLYGSLQGDGKADITGQSSNISDLSKGSLRAQIRKNAYKAIKNMSDGDTLNGVHYVEGHNITISGDLPYETLVVKDGNVVIDGNLNPSKKKLGIIVLKNNYDVNSDYKKKGNIYLNKQVREINAIIYADGALRSADSNGNKYSDSELSKSVTLNGTLFTRNTIGGAVKGATTYTLPGGESTTYDKAEIYDLNYLRKVAKTCDGDDSNDYSFIIRYDSRIQTNPPKLFGE